MNNSRRKFLTNTFIFLGIALCPKSLKANEEIEEIIVQNELKLFVPQQNQNYNILLETDTISNTEYIIDSYEQVNKAFKDNRKNEVIDIDENLILLLSKISKKVGREKKITILSGYRTKETNTMLRKKGKKTAKKSYHMKGQAVDIRIDGVSVKKVAKIARKLKLGGVGRYVKDGFVHVDTGPVRYWKG